ncbi:Lrp/AsnC family transcriptional regulator [Methylomagnum ishizawai]|uniref:Lrp/AsnC family transcriptional regulator n=1 Tax=Methylomagnum ishizawai TaxID=1760988 RepID=UPI001C325B34|nr:Lrp/AsnC family transcriptional regulator [Methylomagnum ishizawai]BBL74128.1 protein NirD [Methylomagnum ishizawai]
MSLTPLQKRLLNDFQRGFPLSPRPFQALAETLGVDEAEVLENLRVLSDSQMVSRVGPVFAPQRVGASTLAALAVPAERLEAVAAWISDLPEVNHNYEREHRYNLWFVLTAADPERLDAALARIERHTGLAVLSLPLLEDFHIDLGFPLDFGSGPT